MAASEHCGLGIDDLIITAQPRGEIRASQRPYLAHHSASNISKTSISSSHFEVPPLPAPVSNARPPRRFYSCCCIPTVLTRITRWRNRRQSLKELKARDSELHQEYLKMRELDRQMEAQKPSVMTSQTQTQTQILPCYGQVIESSGESVVGMGTD